MDRNRLIPGITPIGTAVGPAVRLSALVVAAELSRITPRDRLLLDYLAEHHVFTTQQLADLTLGTVGRARVRLGTLHSRGVLDRFRHYQRPGSQSWRWSLGPIGAAIVAAGRGDPLPRASTVHDATARLATSPRLGHLLAVNGLFVALTAHARTHHVARLTRWWNETRCREACGNLVRPDGHGVWTVSGRAVPFWLEMDLGSEPLPRVAGKLSGYATIGPRRAYPVLIWLPSTVRETNLHTLLSRTGVPDGVTVATAADDHAVGSGGPAGAVWRRYGHPGRLRLTELPAPTMDGDDRWGG